MLIRWTVGRSCEVQPREAWPRSQEEEMERWRGRCSCSSSAHSSAPEASGGGGGSAGPVWFCGCGSRSPPGQGPCRDFRWSLASSGWAERKETF